MDRLRAPARPRSVVIAWDGWTEEEPWRHIFRRKGRRVGVAEINGDGGWDCQVTCKTGKYAWTSPTLTRAKVVLEMFL